MKLYVSGPMTGIEDHNFPAFNAAATKLRALGYEVIDPADKGIIEGWVWEDYLRWDIRALLDCDALAMLPGWLASRGANLEVHVAQALKMRVMPVDYWISMGGVYVVS